MNKLPEWIYFNGDTYYLHEEDCSGKWKGWYSYTYTKPDDDFPVEVTDGKCCYFLVSMETSKERAYSNMLDRINRMKPWLLRNKEI